jgi:acetyl-CoA synthetase
MLTYHLYDLLKRVCQMANVLRETRRDKVVFAFIYDSELAITMLACARIGAIHSVVFAGFIYCCSNRINDNYAKW